MTIMHVESIVSEKSGKRKDGTPYTRKLFKGMYDEGKTGVFSTFYNVEVGQTYEGELKQGKDKQGKPYSTLTFEVESVFTDEQPKPESPIQPPTETPTTMTTAEGTATEYTTMPSEKCNMAQILEHMTDTANRLLKALNRIDCYIALTTSALQHKSWQVEVKDSDIIKSAENYLDFMEKRLKLLK